MEQPALARECRIYIYNLALKVGMRIKGDGLAEGIEIFPKHHEWSAGESGNAIRARWEFTVTRIGATGFTGQTTTWKNRWRT